MLIDYQGTPVFLEAGFQPLKMFFLVPFITGCLFQLVPGDSVHYFFRDHKFLLTDKDVILFLQADFCFTSKGRQSYMRKLSLECTYSCKNGALEVVYYFIIQSACKVIVCWSTFLENGLIIR